jgi:hypothetical protein
MVDLHAIHMLDDPDSTTSDHQVCVAGVTSHNDGVVDWQDGAKCTDGGSRCQR